MVIDIQKLQQEIAGLRQALAEADRAAGEGARVNRQLVQIFTDLQTEKNELVKKFEKLVEEHKKCPIQVSEESISTPSEMTPSEPSLPS